MIIVVLVIITFGVVFKTSSRHPLVLTSTGLFDPRPNQNEDNETHVDDTLLPQDVPKLETTKPTSMVATTETTEASILYTTNPPATGWRVRLYTPTHIVHYNGMWIVVDCWHHRLVYNIDLLAPISQWASVFDKSAPGKIIVPHSVATDGDILVTESSVDGSDGDDHTLEVFQNRGGVLVPTQTLLACPGNKARRPHRVIYDTTTAAFYLYLTNPPHLARFIRNGTALVNDYCDPVPSMGGQYARSIVIRGTSLYITAGPKVITELQLSPTGAFKFLRSYSSKAIGISAGKMNDLAFIDGWWYATSTRRCGLGRFRHLAHPRKTYQDLTQSLLLCTKVSDKGGRCTGGTPYYVTSFEGRIFVPYIFGCSGMVSFVDSNETITDVRQHWGGGWLETAEDMRVRGTKW